MIKTYTLIPLFILTLLLISCNGSQPNISHVMVKSDSLGVMLDTDDNEIIKILQKIFYEKEEKPNGGPEFRFLIDLTISGKTTRWQYSIDGYIRNYEETASMIYLLKDVAEFNRTAKIK